MTRRSHLMDLATNLATAGLATALLVGCSSAPSTKQANNSTVSTSAPGAAAPSAAAAPAVMRLTAQPMGTIPVPAVPGLMPQTNAPARANGVTTGRLDPFAAVQSGPLVFPVKVATAPAKPRIAVSAKPQPVRLPATAPTLSTVPLPSLATTPTVNMPPLSLPVVPASPTAIAERINITGVLQVQGKWHVIVKDSETSPSRYVSAGDTLAGGQVTIKRIIAGIEPLVVLQQNGKEVTRTVGSGTGGFGPVARNPT